MPEKYDFFELKIPYKDKNEYKKIVLDRVAPFIVSLESKGLINGFHFIMHSTLDLRLDPKDEAIEPIQKECKNFNLPTELRKIPDLPPEQYGGAGGVKLCYEALECFSKLIIEMFRANLEELLTHQFIHYFYIQQGIDNFQQIYHDIKDAIMWVDTIKSKFTDKWPPINDKKRLNEISTTLNYAKSVYEGRA